MTPTPQEAMRQEFERLRPELQPPEWTVGEAATYFGFFCHGYEAALRAQPEAVQDEWLEKAMAIAHLYANFAKMKRDPASVEESAEALRTHLSARLLPPQGWQMVPVEPTPEMIAAAAATPGMQAIDSASAIHQLRGNPLPTSAFSDGSPLEQAYRAMLAAAPSKEK